ncbi:lysophospholipid acyltransferase family protein [Alkalimarinus alittae]|uniref:Lysophospholipid acyltransferase family protein n=1 Tax=Alkalimarinus alittae TaxID=2961619 RepID=A0ABY6N5W9_9ALTE|nr:lysophospholipid acyltransferase family protein [Alkalimarinus alittae]UZE97372.1 lysophospholipid acyltransferase family protein [Alkalimarinus alittae]
MKSFIVSIGICAIWLIALLPLSIAHKLGAFIGWILWITNSKKRKISEVNLRLCFPDYSDDEINRIVKKSLKALGKTYTEMGMSWMWPIPKVHKLITHIEGEEYLQQALDENNGIILIAPHLGNWEILNHFFRTYLFMTVMYKTAKIPKLDKFIFDTRKRVDVGLVPADREGVMSLYKILENKGVVAVLPDQQPRIKSGVFAPFFGQKALTGKLIGEMASTTPAYLLCCYAKRMSDGRYSVVLKPANDLVRDPDPAIAATALNKSIEQCILDCPEQYQWSYKRFRTQPETNINFYQ